MPKATVKSVLKVEEGAETVGHVTVRNDGTGVAFLVRLRLVKEKGGEEILPVFWDDNYFSLLPGESREVAVHVRKSDAGGAAIALAVDGMNVAAETVH